MRRAVGARSLLSLLCVLPLLGHSSAQVPYTPSTLLYSSQHNSSFAYLLRTTEGQTEFISLDVSQKIDTKNPLYTILLDDAPFNTKDVKSAYVPVIDQNGVIKVFAGDCWDSGKSPKLWSFSPDSGSSTGGGKWAEFSAQGSQKGSITTRPNYLSAGFAYSASNTTQSSLFTFAGMCPYQSDSSISWVSDANYSQTMTVLVPCKEGNCYETLTTGDRAPPIPEAGFTITPLQATYGYTDDELRQQQDFLLIGGHTQQAFINMSELAIFSAPQNSWSFVSVGSMADASRADLALRNTALIEPRSGHTAVLTADGSKVIVFGGWVGNTSVPATPQLAILEIGGGFAGIGEWTWTVPSTSGGLQGSGLYGIYGHGATMLPGEVMMIAGGYVIPQLSKRSKVGPELNSQIYLYDVKSGVWASSYENPYFDVTAAVTDSSSASGKSSSALKAGLGVGIGIGVPAAAGLCLLAFYLCRRRGMRRTRDSEIRELALGAQRAHYWGRGDSEMASSIRNPSMLRESQVNNDYPWGVNNRPRSTGKKVDWNDNGEGVAERTGLLGGIHIPKKTNRPVLNVGTYRPPYYDFRKGDTAGTIHPIDERDEDEANHAENVQARETLDSQLFVTARNTQVDALHLDGVGPTEGDTGRNACTSSGNDERTSTNLSEASASAKSAKSTPGMGSPTKDKHAYLPSPSREAIRSQDSSISATTSYDKRYSSDSFSTAHSAMSQQQAEGEYLLRDSENAQRSPIAGLFNNKPPGPSRPRASEWIGGIRRVLSVSRRRPPANEGPSTISMASGIDAESAGISARAADTTLPRRSVSASAELFRRKQGAKDWGVGNRFSQDTGFHSARSTRDDFGLDGHIDPDSDDEWDVEGAAEGRRVQVTFTVPKEKLRVVNASAGDMDDLSVNSVSRNNSLS
ncbi:uncharacterized protein DSM5745_10810 [Aspergillus mulundensis]|uniref:Galactose oxidase n=1 Tax=Aspergillus mulundensis TaxID=1810919 RepID=A0A3D8QER9_9EURO|nr:Uncharacterized protein DSM5745_10810 [Aspergillus mulundensis]RDW60352.1 Uncharacterized protein DSM5745_10810 [Aspergillus mulundensis]